MTLTDLVVSEAAASTEELDASAHFFMLRTDRLTKVGKFLRRWSIEELPQLFDVLIG